VPRRKQTQIAWQIIALKATGRLLGTVYAFDEDDARSTAIVRFNIRDPDKVRLLIRRVR
jgi:hypothetical protein